MKTWKPPKKTAVAKHDPCKIFFSKFGQKIDQFFDAPMMKDLTNHTKKSMEASSDTYFHINKSRTQKKVTADSVLEQFQDSDFFKAQNSSIATLGYKINKPFDPKIPKLSKTTTGIKFPCSSLAQSYQDQKTKLMQSYIDAPAPVDISKVMKALVRGSIGPMGLGSKRALVSKPADKKLNNTAHDLNHLWDPDVGDQNHIETGGAGYLGMAGSKRKQINKKSQHI